MYVFGLLILCVIISSVDAYVMCPKVECAPGCVKLDSRGCTCCACGVAMFNHYCSYGMFAMPGAGGGGFVPGTLSGGSLYGNIQGGVHHTAPQKPVRECPGTMLCMMTCKGKYTLGTTGNDGCKSCTCPSQHHVSNSHAVHTVQHVQHQSTCTGTKLCMMTCHGRHILGPKGSDGCNTCTCLPKATPAPTPAPTKSCMATVLCMLSCKSGYSMGKTGPDGCQSCTCVAPPTQPPTTPAPKPLTCRKTIDCMINCKTGYELKGTGIDGCPLCSCRQPQPAKVIIIEKLTCPSKLSCNSGCGAGYKCGTDGCPICECIKPAIVGLQVVEVVQKPVACKTVLSCPKSCTLGYKCGTDGCPTCECLIAVQTVVAKPKPQIIVQQPRPTPRPQVVQVVPQPRPTPKPDQTALMILQKCPNTVKCMDSCQYGYTLGSTGPDGCPSCKCEDKCHTCETHTAVAMKTCDALAKCMLTCDNGYIEGGIDANGCKTCQCAQVCHECEVAKPQVVQQVVATGTKEHCNECEHTSGGSQTVLVATGSNTSGGSSGGGGAGTGSMMGASSGGFAGGMSAGGSGGGADCKPLPPNCHPHCIKYDVAHCRLCTCESNPAPGGGFNG